MLHEALFYLWNCPGDVFKSGDEDDWLNTIELQEFLHPGELKLLQRLMSIASSYHQIQQFIKDVLNHGNHLSTDNEGTVSLRDGLYVRAFSDGLDKVLEDYRNEIVNLEETLLKNPQLTLTYVVASVEKYVTLFEAIKSMISFIKKEQIHGCLLMGKLHNYVDCGIDPIANAANKLIRAINVMFYKQLCNWIIYGNLLDSYNEFFICDAKCDDENFSHGNVQKDSFTTHFHGHSFTKSRFKPVFPVRKFYLNPDMVPKIISAETAETILFLGRIVWIIRNDPQLNSKDKFQIIYKRDVWEGKEVEYFRKLQELENRSFNLAQFDKVIEDCRLCIAKYLWKVMVEEANLLEHLQMIRDYYALGRGELFQQFIVSTEKYLEETPNDYIVTNLNFIFSETARKIYGENDKTHSRFELNLPKNQEQNVSANPWTRFELNFDIVWPLHIIFHPKAMQLYNKLFSFLLRVKKTHIDLHKLWLSHMDLKTKLDPGVMALRNNLMFIVNNLQYYFQVDVIEAQFSILKAAIKSANQFEDIIRLHSKFLMDLTNKIFVMSTEKESTSESKHTLYQLIPTDYVENSIVYKIIIEILKLCDEFCLIASTWSAVPTEPELEELFDFEKRSDGLIEELLRVLYSLHEKSSGYHLLQLLHHIDFNKWFSKNKELNLSTLP